MAKRAKGGAAAEQAANRIILLNRWLRAAADIIGGDTAFIVVTEGGLARVVARHNLAHAFLSVPLADKTPPYSVDDELILPDARGRPDLVAFLGDLGGTTLGMFYRQALSVSPNRRLSLVICGAQPRPTFDERDLILVREIAARMAEEVDRQFPPAAGGGARSLSLSRAGLLEWLKVTDLPAAMFDDDLKLLAVNERLKAAITADWSSLVGRSLVRMGLPAGESLAFLLRHALETGISTPRLEVTLPTGGGLQDAPPSAGAFAVMGAPVSATDGGEVVILTIAPPSATEASTTPNTLAPGPEQVTVDFLMKTLVQRRALRSRNGVSYLTLRSWRQPIREHQIEALKAIKRHSAASLSDSIAGEIADDVASLLGGGFRAVVPMPCGHSAPENCLSLEVARALGRRLSLPVATVLRLPRETGSSHPKANAKRDAMTLASSVEGPVLLVDDVSTSGRHIEEAVTLLRGVNTPAMAIAWIGGDSAGES